MTEIIRSEEQIRALIKALREEGGRLPKYNAFGESNDETLEEMAEWIMELEVALEDGIVRDITSEAGHWLTNERGLLGIDYGVT